MCRAIIAHYGRDFSSPFTYKKNSHPPNEDDGLEAVRLVELAKLAAREGRLVRSTEIELS